MAIEDEDENEIESGYKLAASGAQKLAEAIDLLLYGLIPIAAGKAKDPKEAAESALRAYEDHRGQRLDRAAIMRTKTRADRLKAGADLHAQRAAGVVP